MLDSVNFKDYLNYEAHQKIWNGVKKEVEKVFKKSGIPNIEKIKKRVVSTILPFTIENDCLGCEVAKRANWKHYTSKAYVNCDECPLDFKIKCDDDPIGEEESLWEQLHSTGEKEEIIKIIEQIRDCGWKGE